MRQNSSIRTESWLFDLDDQWAKLLNYYKYDYNHPEDIPEELCGTFDFVLIDPPFITEEVWRKYGEATKKLLAPSGKILLTTTAENAPMLAELLDVKPQVFAPSIPHLVYQYSLYAYLGVRPRRENPPPVTDRKRSAFTRASARQVYELRFG